MKPVVELSIVVPCYNEELVLHALFERVNGLCLAQGYKYELILVDDGSTDSTWKIISKLVNDYPGEVVGVKLSRNFGHQLALSAGLELSCGDRILILDADLQDPPELLPEMMNLMDDGADVVYGQREQREGETMFKKLSAAIFYKLLNQVSDIHIPENTGDFRLISKRVKEDICSMPEKQRFIRGMIAWLGYKQVAIKYRRKPRFAGKTKYPLRKMFLFSVDAITSFSVSPIRISSYAAMVFSLISLVFFLYIIVSWLVFETVPGWASLGFIITILSSCQFIVLGIIGEYVGRIFLESKNRPLFRIDTVKREKE